MKFIGTLNELKSRHKNPIEYHMLIDDHQINLNQYIGTKVKLIFLNEIHCVYCGRKVKKTFNNGSCYPCFTKLPQNDLCIVKPSLCHFEKGTCRNNEFGETQCNIPHYVYLALSSDVKVGLTRKTNALKRWVDQGAVKAIPIAELPTRKMAGELELLLSEHIKDKTNWRKMLKGDIENVDLLIFREEVKALIPKVFQPYVLDLEEENEFNYPQFEALDKIVSISLDKQPIVDGKLIGIKGQYLLFDHGVINIKKHSGYKVALEV